MADPSSYVARQRNIGLKTLGHALPLADGVTGTWISDEADSSIMNLYNYLLDAARKRVDDAGEDKTAQESLGGALDAELAAFLGARGEGGAAGNRGGEGGGAEAEAPLPRVVGPLELRVLDWHMANLEYGCSARLDQVSLPYWNQDDVYGGFGGPHCMVQGGFGAVPESLAVGLDVRLGVPVREVAYSLGGHAPGEGKGTAGSGPRGGPGCVRVTTASGEVFEASAAVITVPLGCLKAGDVAFSPPLPEWKEAAIGRLGFGNLNKLILEFPHVFWKHPGPDFFGAALDGGKPARGCCSYFWNLVDVCGAPVLACLLAGASASDTETRPVEELVTHAMGVLRSLFPGAPDPVASGVSQWGAEQYTRGSYSYVAVGSSGEDYNVLGRPVEGGLFFAGEGWRDAGGGGRKCTGVLPSPLPPSSLLDSGLASPIPLVSPRACHPTL